MAAPLVQQVYEWHGDFVLASLLLPPTVWSDLKSGDQRQWLALFDRDTNISRLHLLPDLPALYAFYEPGGGGCQHLTGYEVFIPTFPLASFSVTSYVMLQSIILMGFWTKYDFDDAPLTTRPHRPSPESRHL